MSGFGHKDKDNHSFAKDPVTGKWERCVSDNDTHDKLDDLIAAVGGSTGTVKNIYNEVTSVASSTLTTVVTYTVPAGKIFCLQFVDIDGTNIATYTVLRDATIEAKRRTYYPKLNSELNFIITNDGGLDFVAGEVITLKVTHARPMVGDFTGRIVGIESNA